MNAKVILLQEKQHTVLKGHPWVFPKAIAKIQGKPQTGHLVQIYNASEEFLGVGIYNEHSLYRVRILALNNEPIDIHSLGAIVNHRIKQALLVRHSLGLPNPLTTAYRLFNSEGDGLSGLTIDRFNEICVVSSSAYWVELHRQLIQQAIQECLPEQTILWIAQSKALQQDGWEANTASDNSQEAIVLEEGIQYQIQFARAQKTGLFLDQRENHQRLATYCKGKSVLDLYTYTGGFALHAAKAGAKKVTAVDSSAHAIEQAKRNAQLNGIDSIEWVEADAREYLANAGDYDVVVLDPPKLVPSKKHLEKAKNYYRFLHREVFKVMTPGALLMTCNCSSALSSAEFAALVSAQAATVGKQARILGIYGPASCHPILAAFPEGNYLTAILMAVV